MTETSREDAVQAEWAGETGTAGDDMLGRLQRLIAKRLDTAAERADETAHETKRLQRGLVSTLRELRGVEEEVPRLQQRAGEQAQQVQALISKVVEARATLEGVRDRLAELAGTAREDARATE